jgi:hypothetical protein
MVHSSLVSKTTEVNLVTAVGAIECRSWKESEVYVNAVETDFIALWTHITRCTEADCLVQRYFTVDVDGGYISFLPMMNEMSTKRDGGELIECRQCGIAFSVPEESPCDVCDGLMDTGDYGKLRWKCYNCHHENNPECRCGRVVVEESYDMYC